MATIALTPAVHRQKLLKPISPSSNSTPTADESEDLAGLKEFSQGDKVIVIPEDAKKSSLNVEVDVARPDQILPVDKIDNVDGIGFEDPDINDEKVEEILNNGI